jgi:interferon-induced GTP-binding protein Mx1
MLESNTSRNFIEFVQSQGLDRYIQLPQLVSMGDTSSGKSSVLSHIAKIQFPSSEKLTTRCPTQLILRRADTFSGTIRIRRYQTNVEEQVTHLGSVNEIASEISRLTEQLVDEGQSISEDTIEIKCQGPDFPDLTLTDLPGYVRTVQDNEDESIIEKVDQLIARFLNQERTIIPSS